jgi:hypothetical protein
MRMRRVALLVALALCVSGVASAASVPPVLIPGANNDGKTCAEKYGSAYPGVRELRIEKDPIADAVISTTQDDGLLRVTIVVPSTEDLSNSNSFDWSSNASVLGVIVKDGVDGAYWYDYSPGGSTGDTWLTTPGPADGGTYKGISHINFCYVPKLMVSKTANASYTRTYEWTIDKSVTPDEWDLFTGDSGTSEYTVSVAKTGYQDSAWAVQGATCCRPTARWSRTAARPSRTPWQLAAPCRAPTAPIWRDPSTRATRRRWSPAVSSAAARRRRRRPSVRLPRW